MDAGNTKSNYPYWLSRELNNSELTILNKGIPGNTVQDLQRRLKRDVLKEKPNLVIIMIGSNNLLQGESIGAIISQIILLHQEIQDQKIKTLGVTIPPVCLPEVNNSWTIEEFNLILIEKFEANNIMYADPFKHYQNEKGNLKSEFNVGDGIHLSVKAYEMLGKIIGKKIKRIE